MALLKQSTSYTRAFLLVQSSDHITGLTGASPTVTLSKAGGAFAAAGGTVTEISSGWYKIALTTTDTNTLGDLAFHITATSGDPSDFADQVTANILGDTLPANVTQISGSAVSTSTAQLGVNVVNVGGTAQTARDIGASVLLSPGTGTGQISLASGAVTVGTNNDKTGYRLDATASAAMTESYATKGSAPTLAQVLYEIRAHLCEKSVSGTTLTINKLDGATQAETFTLNSSTSPTAITRAS